ncbi:MAG: amidohydrolase [Candidatus Aminicenantes bacterium]|nr:MAG: amidohydrolase [Candidatus Aminicenantes bacterium]
MKGTKKTRLIISMILTLSVGFLNFCNKENDIISQEKATLMLTNCNIISVDENIPKADAIAIKDDKIIALGSSREIEKYKGEHTKLINLQGKTAVPGFIDSHMHFPELGKRVKQLYLDKTKNVEEALAIVKEVVKKAKPEEWITGMGWHTAYWKTLDYPNNSELSKISPQNPVFLIGMASHAAWVNDKALKLAGITKDTSDPPGGKIIKNPETGEPTGILIEKAQDLISKLFPAETYDSKKADIKLSIRTALSLGLTEVHDAGVDYDIIKIYKELLEEGELPLRLYVMFLVPDGGEVLDKYLISPPEIGLGNNFLTFRCIKVFVDGALGARGAALLSPYSDSPKDTGLIRNSEEEIYKVVYKSMKAGYQVAIHAIGDRGNRIALNATEKAQKKLSTKNFRVRIEHAQILSPQDIPRFAELCIIPSMQPIHCTMDMGFAEARVGPERMKGAYAWKTLLETGVKIAAGSDTPAFPVDNSNPLWGIYAAVTRQNNQGQPPGGWYPEEKVSRLDALKMYTINAAYAAFEENIKGTIAPGKLADITVLSKDILTIPEPEIWQTEVLMTIVGGKIIYQK